MSSSFHVFIQQMKTLKHSRTSGVPPMFSSFAQKSFCHDGCLICNIYKEKLFMNKMSSSIPLFIPSRHKPQLSSLGKKLEITAVKLFLLQQ